MDLSYAQNLEDYVLWRALGEKPSGFYIDVGGGHPVADNVSCWFYLAGWRGIVVEPQDNLAHMYAHVRPRDAIFHGVAGAASGEVEFHVVDRLHGMSSLRADAAATAAQFGAAYTTVRAQMATLNDLIEREGAREIDFLKIDVEGAEAQVLAGLDLSRHRPKAMCIEAVAPGDMADNWSEWEPGLIAQGYDFMLFDGLNRYYAAREAADVLARFPRLKPEWGIVPTLGLWERAPTNSAHPDHTLARTLARGFLARLPMLDRTLLFELLMDGFTREDRAGAATPAAKERALTRLLPGGAFPHARDKLAAIEAPTVEAYCMSVVDSDHFRVALARIAMSYDGGQIIDGDAV
ncbi:MAG: FkbM family methyltransferase [Beijerinckiaceae bacterium]|nr:FkbM family methyltransferase [Beijerinckiaceae bacterium]